MRKVINHGYLIKEEIITIIESILGNLIIDEIFRCEPLILYSALLFVCYGSMILLLIVICVLWFNDSALWLVLVILFL